MREVFMRKVIRVPSAHRNKTDLSGVSLFISARDSITLVEDVTEQDPPRTAHVCKYAVSTRGTDTPPVP